MVIQNFIRVLKSGVDVPGCMGPMAPWHIRVGSGSQSELVPPPQTGAG